MRIVLPVLCVVVCVVVCVDKLVWNFRVSVIYLGLLGGSYLRQDDSSVNERSPIHGLSALSIDIL